MRASFKPSGCQAVFTFPPRPPGPKIFSIRFTFRTRLLSVLTRANCRSADAGYHSWGMRVFLEGVSGTSALIPAFSPRRRGMVRPLFTRSYAGSRLASFLRIGCHRYRRLGLPTIPPLHGERAGVRAEVPTDFLRTTKRCQTIGNQRSFPNLVHRKWNIRNKPRLILI